MERITFDLIEILQYLEHRMLKTYNAWVPCKRLNYSFQMGQIDQELQNSQKLIKIYSLLPKFSFCFPKKIMKIIFLQCFSLQI